MRGTATEDGFVETALRELSVADILDLVRESRIGSPLRPETVGDSYVALSLLQRFAEFRSVADLVEAASRMAGAEQDHDVEVLIGTAAFTMPPDRVARLAAALLAAGHGDRTVLLAEQCATHAASRSLALFVDALLEEGYEDLADRALGTAAGQRPISDLARLYLILQAAGHAERAERLIDAILPPVRTVAQLREFSIVLAHLSPHDPTLVGRVLSSAQQKLTVRQIVELVRVLEPVEVARPFIEDVVRWRPIMEIHAFYKMLTDAPGTPDGQPGDLADLGDLVIFSAVRVRSAEELISLAAVFDQGGESAALHRFCWAIARTIQTPPFEDPAMQVALLAELLQRWDRALRASLGELIGEITAEVTPDMLEQLARRLDALNAKDLALEMYAEVVRSPQRWSGAALSRLVLDVGRLDRAKLRTLRVDKQRSTARVLAVQLAGKREEGRMDGAALADYVHSMDNAGRPEFSDLVIDAMLDVPAREEHLLELAGLLYQVAPGRQRGVGLLVSWLRQSQLVPAARLPDIVKRMANFLAAEEVVDLLGQTIQRWPRAERAAAVKVLRKTGFERFADAVGTD